MINQFAPLTIVINTPASSFTARNWFSALVALAMLGDGFKTIRVAPSHFAQWADVTIEVENA